MLGYFGNKKTAKIKQSSYSGKFACYNLVTLRSSSWRRSPFRGLPCTGGLHWQTPRCRALSCPACVHVLKGPEREVEEAERASSRFCRTNIGGIAHS
jgi:hypothetical protein